MRVLHVATLVTPDGAYGGPIRVAVNQVRELRRQGVDAVLIAGFQGDRDACEKLLTGIPAVLFPVQTLGRRLGFAGYSSRAMRAWLRRHLGSFDLVHFHVARDLITMPAAMITRTIGVPYVLQPHGMIADTSHPARHVVDMIATRRVLASAASVLVLTSEEREHLSSLGIPASRLATMPNGVPLPDTQAQPADGELCEVLFLSRLHSRKRPLEFVRAAEQLVDDYPYARFTLAGPDGGEADRVGQKILAIGNGRVSYEGPVSPNATMERLSQASVIALPSVREPFPMVILEAMSLGRPVIVTRSCGLARVVEEAEAGIVVSDEPGAIIPAIDRLLVDADLRRSMGANAELLIRRRFSINAVAEILIHIYERALSSARPNGARSARSRQV